MALAQRGLFDRLVRELRDLARPIKHRNPGDESWRWFEPDIAETYRWLGKDEDEPWSRHVEYDQDRRMVDALQKLRAAMQVLEGAMERTHRLENARYWQGRGA